MAKIIIWIVEDSGELTKAWVKYAVNEMFQMIGITASACVEILCSLNPFLIAMSIEKFCDKAHHNASLLFQAILLLAQLLLLKDKFIL